MPHEVVVNFTRDGHGIFEGVLAVSPTASIHDLTSDMNRMVSYANQYGRRLSMILREVTPPPAPPAPVEQEQVEVKQPKKKPASKAKAKAKKPAPKAKAKAKNGKKQGELL